jgi:hypothetical protein
MYENTPQLGSGLTPKHRLELLGLHNGTLEVPSLEARCMELRVEYAGNPYALEEIDFNDFSSEYSLNLRGYYEVMARNDTEAVERFEEWFDLNYPLHGTSL